MYRTAPAILFMVAFSLPAAAAPRVWLADQGNNQGQNNRIMEIDPVNLKNPPDADGTNIIILRTIPSPAGAFLDELDFDDQQRLWCVVKNTPDQSQDGVTRIDKETGAIQLKIFPVFPGESMGGILEGMTWDGSGLWISAVRDGLAGNMLTRVNPQTGAIIAPFNSGTLGAKVNIPGNIAQGLLYDPSGSGFLWQSDNGVNKIFKLDLARLYDADPGNDNNLKVAEYSVPFAPKGMAWLGNMIWVTSPKNGIYEFNPATGATRKLFNSPNWNLDGLAILAGPRIVVNPASLNPTVWLGQTPANGAFTVTNGGDGTLTYTVVDDSGWMNVTPSGGSSTGESDPFTVIYNVAGLSAGTYSGVITVTAPGATNSPITLPVTLTIQTVKPDMDGDGDVDMQDFGLFQACYSGSGFPQNASECQKARIDADTDVDLNDFALFQACLTGANIMATPGCDGSP